MTKFSPRCGDEPGWIARDFVIKLAFFEILASAYAWTIRTLWSWTVINREEYFKLNMLHGHIYI